MGPVKPPTTRGTGSPRIKGNYNRTKSPGGRHGTSMAQRNASRRNIRRAHLAKKARKVQ